MAATHDEPTLGLLAETINNTCARVAEAEVAALDYAIAAGRSLLQAKALVPGSWMDWVAVNLQISHVTANAYMRLAHYEREVRSGCATSIGHARELTQGLPPVLRPVDEGVLDRVRDGSLSQKQAAAELGVSREVIRHRIRGSRTRDRSHDKQARNARNQRDRDARAALRKQEEARAVRKSAKPVSEAYALVRRALLAVDVALGEVENKEAKAHLATATRRLHAAEDEIVRASRLS